MADNTNLSQKIEALLFYRGEPVTFKELAKICATDIATITDAIDELMTTLQNRGITLLIHDDTVTLGTHPDLSETIDEVRKKDISRDIGKAGVETLSIILYKGPVARSEIDFIRGVNSSFILRNLLVRGLIERLQKPGDSRSYLYQPTLDLLAHLGIEKKEQLPGYQETVRTLEQFIAEHSTDNEMS